MKLKNLVGERFKERPSDCKIDSHALMVRGGYIKYVANGIYSSFVPIKRIARKIEQIIREEMDKIDGQEVMFPVVLPASLWEESGRYESVGDELLRISDRNNNKLVLGMTHEEAAVHLVREYGQSYLKYPFMIYQIQTKFRDEARPRGGLIRVREFTMKDAYSFHTSQDDLENYYAKCHKAYERIFERVGLPQVISVASDSGMMGGNVSHEFMLLTPVGEDSIVTCRNCDYRSNMEAAENIVNIIENTEEDIKLVHTPNAHTIEEICCLFNITEDKTCKSVVYQKESDNSYVIVFLRGDYEANEAKLKNILGSDIYPAIIDEKSKLVAGFIGPYNLAADCEILFDKSLENNNNLICGGNQLDYHYTGFSIRRDIKKVDFVDVAKAKENGICPNCKSSSLTISRGIEVGNIFQLGTKYTKAMNMTYLDENGDVHNPIMGCYGIGVGRLAASVCEAYHDDFGPIWPMSIAPWQVHLCAVRADDKDVKDLSDNIYSQLEKEGIEVIYDDRTVSVGVMFSDADLLGVPIRIIVSPRNLKENCIEIVTRDKSYSEKVDISNSVEIIKKFYIKTNPSKTLI
ncbi:MAG: proline--tRNA ligase [Oscillospiraceae bacterium]|nr:proline--tRNA ligase [Oscillospiraceae bacterium]